MIHAERNALANCVVRPDGGIAYVTGQCCNDCIMSLWQEGIETVIMHDTHGTHLFDEKQKEIFNNFILLSNIKIEYVRPDLSWLRCNIQ
jgi:deoxycytidylate deaminase